MPFYEGDHSVTNAIMSALVVILLLSSAVVHAGWNAVVKGSDDRLWSISMIAMVGACCAIPFAIGLEPPGLQSVPYLILSSLLQVMYCLFLVRAYRHGDLAAIYPIARGIAPLLVTLGALLLAQEIPTGLGLAGICAVSLGIACLALGRGRPDVKSVAAAMAAGVFIASYMVVDGLGVRVSDSALGYVAWQSVAGGSLIPLAFILVRRQLPRRPIGQEGAAVVVAGILGTLGYCIAVWAMSFSNMGGVSALRETSILFAALLGVFVFGERMTAQKVIGALCVTGGVVCLSLS